MADLRRSTTIDDITVAQARAMLDRLGIDAPVPTAFSAPIQEDGWQSATITNAAGVDVLALLEIMERANMPQPPSPPPDARSPTFGKAVRAEQDRARLEAGAGARARGERTVAAIADVAQWLVERRQRPSAKRVIHHWAAVHNQPDSPPVPSIRTVERQLKTAISHLKIRGTRYVGMQGGGDLPR